MTVLLQRLFLAASLAMVPALAIAASEPDEKKEETATEAPADTKAADDDADKDTDADNADADAGKKADAEEDTSEEDAEWAEKLRQRHHEGDVALGVCGARLTALMWFYQSSVADGRDDLQSAYEALKESRTVLKNEAERRAVEDRVGTSVSVMNEHSTELWDDLVEASEKPETFQEAHDALFANVQECLSLFFNRGKKPIEDSADADEEEKPEEKAD